MLEWFRKKEKKQNQQKSKLTKPKTKEELQFSLESEEEIVFGQSLKGSVPSIKDLVAPDGYKETENYMQVGSKRYSRVFVIAQLPRIVQVGFLEIVYGLGDVDVSVHLYPVNGKSAVEQLTRQITQLESQRIIEEKRGDIYNLSLLTATRDDLWQLREAIQTGREKLYHTTILINLSAHSPEDLDRKSLILEERLAGRGMELRSMFLRQAESYRSTLLLGRNEVMDIYRTLNMGGALSLFPFLNPELTHDSGIFLGRNFHTGAPIFFDSFKGQNYSMVLIGTAGAGKSVTVKAVINRGAIEGIRSLIVDVEGEYKNTTLMIGGAHIPLYPDRPAMLNPLEIEVDIDDDTGEEEVRVREKVVQVADLLTIMCMGTHGEAISAEERAIIEEAVLETYRDDFGISEKPDSLYEEIPIESSEAEEINLGYRRKEMPTISNVYNRIVQKEGAIRLSRILKPFLRTGTMGMFDGPSQIDLKDVPVICFNLKPLGESFLRPLAMYIVSTWAWETWIKRNRHVRKRFIADEAWVMMGYEEMASFLELLSRRGRKWNISLMVASQSFVEFVENPKGKAILTNAMTRLLMKQSPTDIDAVCEVFKLTEGEREFIASCGQGEGLLQYDKEKLAVEVVCTPEELEFFNTTPQIA
ncbi:DUF87 domain-containing protein [Heliorestis acidaminivorans]|uniref:DUF87 domain-containing protein n=1 Tax=Heliorestis acidaminivorans TaxID=553427 RepID=A0A6I0EVP7_9FIRM|nr:DUF87 domain-containing protein [Heliorestis acidaminivorans]KAB2951998.1 DUF87 domain-containing protein [Heliorestis acidaminivorans]